MLGEGRKVVLEDERAAVGRVANATGANVAGAQRAARVVRRDVDWRRGLELAPPRPGATRARDQHPAVAPGGMTAMHPPRQPVGHAGSAPPAVMPAPFVARTARTRAESPDGVRYPARIPSATASTASAWASTITAPPKPPPVWRAP